MFTVNKHRLVGSDAQGKTPLFEASPNFNANGSITPRFLVFHYTACSQAAARAVFLNGNAPNRVSAHLLVDSDGSVTQFVPFNKRAWHAGESFWAGLTDINTWSIGIEVVNLGYVMKRGDGSFLGSDGRTVLPSTGVVEARHKNPADTHNFWQAYTAEQIETCAQLAEVLVPAYSLQDIVGHEDIAPLRKIDPGPAFPMRRIASRAFGRADNDPGTQQLYVGVGQLNIRKGPGTSFEPIGPALTLNTIVRPLQPAKDGWMQVEAVAPAPNTGWVAAAYLRPAPV